MGAPAAVAPLSGPERELGTPNWLTRHDSATGIRYHAREQQRGSDLAELSNAGTGGITDAMNIGQLCCSIARSVRYLRRCRSAGDDSDAVRPRRLPPLLQRHTCTAMAGSCHE